jgi:hypothetical protein
MGTGSLATAGLEVVQECRCPIGDLMVLEVPERVEQGVGIAVLGEADAQVMLDRVAPADGDVMVVVPVPIATHECPNAFGGLVGQAGWSVATSFSV